MTLPALRIAWHGFQLGWAEFSVLWTWWSWFLLWLVRMASQAAFIVLLGQLIGPPATVRYLVIGNVLVVGTIATMSWATGILSSDRRSGTYSLLVVAPASMLPAILGRGSVSLLNGVATTVLSFLLIGPLLGVSVEWPLALLGIPLVALMLGSVLCLSILLAGISARLPGSASVLSTTMASVIQVICGANVPVSFWPVGIQVIANCLPLTHGLEALRLLLDAGDSAAILRSVALEVVVGLSWLAAGILCLDWLANSGRADGSIEYVPH